MMSLNFVISIESSHTRGMGHFFRSLLFVSYFQENGLNYKYLINKDTASQRILDEKKIPYIIVDYNDGESGWEKKIVEYYKIDIWIMDKFTTTEIMAKSIKDTGAYLVMLDDVGLGAACADIRFEGVIGLGKKSEENVYRGNEYIIINNDINRFRRLRNCINKIIVVMGGSDPYDVSVEVVKELLKYNYNFDVLVGPNSKCYMDLRDLSEFKHFNIYRHVDRAIELYSNYDLAITGGGFTGIEMSALGIPIIIIANAQHEIKTAKYLEGTLKCALYAGDYQNWDKSIIGKIPNINVLELSENGLTNFNVGALEKIMSKIYEHYSAKKKMNSLGL